ncbi:MAG: DUF3618 domain-containing protein, partial [Thermomicrobiales bacterium]
MGEETTRLDDDRDPLNAMPANDATASDDPDAIEHEIEQTRAEMSGTIDEIQDRLNPERLKAQAKEAAHDATIGRVIDAKDQAVEKVQDLASQAADKVRNITGGNGESHDYSHGTSSQFTATARDAGNSVVDTIRANPVPAAIAGVGLGWFLTRRSDHHEGRSGYMRNTPANRSGYRGQQLDYRTGYTNWDQNQPDPGSLRQYEGDTFMSQVSGAGSGVVGMVQRNPIPAALAGVGLGWFLMRRNSGGDHGDQPYYYRPGQQTTSTGGYGYQGSQGNWQPAHDTQGYGAPSYSAQSSGQQGSDSAGGLISEVAGSVQETAGDAIQRAQDTAGEAMHRAQDFGSQAAGQVSHYGSVAREQVGQLPHQAQNQFQNLRGTYEQKMQDAPLMMGVVAMSLGLAVGMLLPETQKENQVFGEKRDELMDRAQDMAGQAVERVQEAAQDAAHAAQETVQEATQ